MYEFFHEQSNYKVGASENKLRLDSKVNKKLFDKNYLTNTSDKHAQLSIKKFILLIKLTKSKLKFNLTKKFLFFINF